MTVPPDKANLPADSLALVAKSSNTQPRSLRPNRSITESFGSSIRQPANSHTALI